MAKYEEYRSAKFVRIVLISVGIFFIGYIQPETQFLLSLAMFLVGGIIISVGLYAK